MGWYAPKQSGEAVYRLYNANAGDHHYTLSEDERDYLISVGWTYEDIGWYSDKAAGVPVYRQYNPNATGAGSHNYTKDEEERDALVLAGWKDEDIGWYCSKTDSSPEELEEEPEEPEEEVRHNLAERTTGKSLAIIQNVVDLAYRNAVKDHKSVTDDILLNALEEYMYGEKKERDEDYYKKVAIHEVGHAYVSYINGDKPSYITIESRGDFGGYMQHSNQEVIPEYTREELIGRIRTCLAGRAAEAVFFGKEKSLNTGASSDLENATNYA